VNGPIIYPPTDICPYDVGHKFQQILKDHVRNYFSTQALWAIKKTPRETRGIF